MQVDDVLARISSGSKAQIDGLRSLTSAMTLINDLASKNTSMADDTRHASEEISQRSGSLAGLVNDFKLTNDGAAQFRTDRAA